MVVPIEVEDRVVGTEFVAAVEIAMLETDDVETAVLERDVGETTKLEVDDGETAKLEAGAATALLEVDDGEITMGKMGEPEIGALELTDEMLPVTDDTVPSVCEVSV
jgi:hypothetical protein